MAPYAARISEHFNQFSEPSQRAAPEAIESLDESARG
jgi:hypothetical protein